MKISTAHQRFADQLDDQTALEYSERFLGPNWKNVLNFWIYLDSLSVEDFDIVTKRYWALDRFYRVSVENNAFKAAKDTNGNDYEWAAWEVTPTFASAYATSELIGSHKLESLNFLPLFLAP